MREIEKLRAVAENLNPGIVVEPSDRRKGFYVALGPVVARFTRGRNWRCVITLYGHTIWNLVNRKILIGLNSRTTNEEFLRRLHKEVLNSPLLLAEELLRESQARVAEAEAYLRQVKREHQAIRRKVAHLVK